MSGVSEKQGAEAAGHIAQAFRDARLGAVPLIEFPGPFPRTIDAAYAIQDRAIADFPDRVVGWKVAGIAPEFHDQIGVKRICGPVFSVGLKRQDGPLPVRFPVFAGGFAAVEAEFILVMGRDIRPGEALSSAALADSVASMHGGVETAGSPFAEINALGPLSVVSDFGNNNGVILGGEIAGWRTQPLESITARTRVNGEVVGEGSAAKVAGGPLAALEFLVGNLAQRGMTLKAGDVVSTGMTTGVHNVVAGDRVEFEFVGGIGITALAVPAAPAL